MSIIDLTSARGLAFAHAAETMLRTLGGVEIAIRFAAPSSVAMAEFGLPNSSTFDVTISPVLVRNAVMPQVREADLGPKEFLLPSAAVQNAASANGYTSASDWLAAALGIVCDGALYRIANVAAESFAGQPYLYRVTTS
jgi:hypothetical protein